MELTRHVLDACAMLAVLRNEPGSRVLELLSDQDALCMAHVINLCEVYYDLLRSTDQPTADQWLEDLLALGFVEYPLTKVIV